jgi:hypothetical protein
MRTYKRRRNKSAIVQVNMRIRQSMRLAIKILAERNGMSFNAQTVMLLDESFCNPKQGPLWR